MALLVELHRAGVTVIVVTHDPAVGGYADRVLRFADGRIVEDKRVASPPREAEATVPASATSAVAGAAATGPASGTSAVAGAATGPASGTSAVAGAVRATEAALARAGGLS
ncbi:MAG TPA: hypothetical protein VFS00_04210, partial [Polyangiaceae bacterium]|nr:hypothetical protein [Polyangiaceae bacterium]